MTCRSCADTRGSITSGFHLARSLQILLDSFQYAIADSMAEYDGKNTSSPPVTTRAKLTSVRPSSLLYCSLSRLPNVELRALLPGPLETTPHHICGR